MVRYFPEEVPNTDDLHYIREWLGREFSRVAAAFEGVEQIQLPTLGMSVGKPQDGMIILADGVSFDPGEGAGYYGWWNGAWRKLDVINGANLGGDLDMNGFDIIDADNVEANSGSFSGNVTANDFTGDLTGNVAGDLTGNVAGDLTGDTTGSHNGPVGDVTPNTGEFTGVTADTVTLLDGQLVFPATQNPSSNANTLDDYEEGTFTPGFSFGGGTTGITYSVQLGTYVKAGRFVFVTIDMTLSNNGSSSGNWFIEGLPIPDETVTNFNGTLPVSFYSSVSLPGTDRSLQCTVQQDGNGRGIFRAGGSGGSFTLNDTHTTNTTRVIMAGGYRSAD